MPFMLRFIARSLLWGALIFAGGIVLASLVAVLLGAVVTVAAVAPLGLLLYALIARRLGLPPRGFRGPVRERWRRRQATLRERIRRRGGVLFGLAGSAPAQAPPHHPVEAAREAAHLTKEIGYLVRHSDRATREALAGVPRSARKLAEHIAKLARLAGELDAHLADADPAALSRRVAEMESRAGGAADPIVREQYQATARSLAQQAHVCRELVATRERTHAEIARTLAALGSLRSRILATRTGLASQSADMHRAADELADLQQQVETFDDSVRQVLRQASSAAR